MSYRECHLPHLPGTALESGLSLEEPSCQELFSEILHAGVRVWVGMGEAQTCAQEH